MALEMQNFEALSPPVVKKITWWTLLTTVIPTRCFDIMVTVPLPINGAPCIQKLSFWWLTL